MGFGPTTINRPEVLRRLDGSVPTWIVDPLLDDFEQAALAAMKTAAANKKKIGRKPPRSRGDTGDED